MEGVIQLDPNGVLFYLMPLTTFAKPPPVYGGATERVKEANTDV